MSTFQLSIYRGAAPSSGDLQVAGSSTGPVPWGILRLLLGALEAAGELLELPAPLSLLLSKQSLPPEPPPCFAVSPGYMSHNRYFRRSLLESWVELLAPRLSGKTLAIHGAADLDPMSFEVLVRLLRATTDFHLKLAYDPDELPSDLLERACTLRVYREIERLLGLEQARLYPREQGDDRGPAATPPLAWSSLDGGLELQALAEIGSDKGEDDLLFRALEKGFACFGFGFVLRCGRAFLQRSERGTPEQRRRIHGLVAISAYNLQVKSVGELPEADASRADFIERHLRASLEGEQRPEHLSHGHYRMAIHLGRRKRELDEALQWATGGVDIAREASLPSHEAWSLNGRAFVLARQGKLDLARNDCERAMHLLQTPLAQEGPLERERLLSHIVMVDNFATLHMFLKQWDEALHWQGQVVSMVEELGVEYSYQRMVDLYLREHRLEQAKELLQKACRGAQEGLDPLHADIFAAQLADVYYRRGEAKKAHELFKGSLEISQRMQSRELVQASQMSCAMAALRAGALAEAREVLGLLLADADEATEIELWSLKAVVAAKDGEVEESESCANQAIELAMELGARELLVRVACAAGEACFLLGRREEAAEAFEQALEWSREDTDACDRFGALIGAIKLSPEPAWIDEALTLLPEALEDSESWWLLDDLAQACTSPDHLLSQALSQRV